MTRSAIIAGLVAFITVLGFRQFDSLGWEAPAEECWGAGGILVLDVKAVGRCIARDGLLKPIQ